MDSKRAKAIVGSPVMANVTHNYVPVYMEKVNESAKTCTIHYLDEPQKRETVELNSLVEHDSNQ